MKKLLTLFLALAALTMAAAEKATKIIALDDLDYKSIEQSCQALLGKDGKLVYFPNNRAVMVEDTEDNIKRVDLFIKFSKEELKKKAPVTENKTDAKETSKPAAVPNHKIIPLGNVEYGTIETTCRPWLSADGKMVYSLNNNAVIVTDTPKVIAAIEKFVSDLAKVAPEPAYGKIDYNSLPADSSDSTVIIYSNGWYDNGWYGGWYSPYYRRYWGPPPRPRPPRPPLPPRPPRPPVPVPVPNPNPGGIRPGNPGPPPSGQPSGGYRGGGGRGPGGGRR